MTAHLISIILLLMVIVAVWHASTARSAPPRQSGETLMDARWDNPVNRALIRIARCETGGKPGQHGRPDWTHRARSEHAGLDYMGALGFLETTWEHYRRFVRPLPPSSADQATPAQQLAVARVLVRTFGGYSSWPACSRRLRLR